MTLCFVCRCRGSSEVKINLNVNTCKRSLQAYYQMQKKYLNIIYVYNCPDIMFYLCLVVFCIFNLSFSKHVIKYLFSYNCSLNTE